MGTESTRTLKSIKNAFQIIQLLQEKNRAGVTELEKEMDLATSTIHSYLATLEELEYVINNNGTYRLGLKFLNHGISAKALTGLPSVVCPPLCDLADEIEATTWFLIEEHGRAVFLAKGDSENADKSYGRVSKRTPLHTHAGGKAILAHLSPPRIETIIDRHRLPAQTDSTITDRNVLFDELDRIRDEGVAFSEDEEVLGNRCVAVPVIGEQVVGSVCIFLMTHHMTETRFKQELPELLSSTAETIESQIGTNPMVGR
jgi:DNA-binding IclR family transcriptional regulator